VCSLASLQVLSESNHPEACDPSTYYFEYHVWAAVTNVGVSVILSIVFYVVGVGDSAAFLEMVSLNSRQSIIINR
jgi:hypothetical protein